MEHNHQERSMKDKLAACHTLEELHDTFGLPELFEMLSGGLLQEWLHAHFFDAQANRLADTQDVGTDARLLRLCETLSVDIAALSDCDAALVAKAARRAREKETRERECGPDGKIVASQAELMDALQNEDISKIYLCDGEYTIPSHRSRITYVGRQNALAHIYADEALDFDAREVYFYDLTLVFHFLERSQVKIDHSGQNKNHLIFLRDNRARVAMDDSISLHEMAALLDGRTPFESETGFAERAERFRSVIVGKVCLRDLDYDMRRRAFFLRPVWRVDFIETIRAYLRGARLAFPVDCGEAAKLYETGRAQLIYADFRADGDKAVLGRLYLHADDGKGARYPIYRIQNETSWAFGSGSGSAGYGLDLIDDYE